MFLGGWFHVVTVKVSVEDAEFLRDGDIDGWVGRPYVPELEKFPFRQKFLGILCHF